MAPTTPLLSDPHPNANAEPAEWRPNDRDPQKWTDAEIAAGLNTLPIPSCTLFVHRANRHDRTSAVQGLTLECADALSYEAITQIAGLFETPHIIFAPAARKLGDCGGDDVCIECIEPFTSIIVRWEALPPVAKRGNVEVPR